ncbi:hypothetical protein [Microcystis aeruginosa]|uniref:hypothetical protein n=1 Tax=Microcystis aeruginosa TaxID=1126 RepID=UPI000776AC36|nr:hypothetical protein [Microcystis aeruginosa]KXS92814.1 hypothetical protein OA58_04520 [Microcystis aeruginosa NIES-88]BCU13013.1 hypothetical protein MAN88_35770 [Microcystis aeruginosa]
MTINKLFTFALFTAIFWLYSSKVQASVLTNDGRFQIEGSTELVIDSITGSADSLNVNTGSEVIPTGEITYQLDTNKISKLIVNFDTNLINVDLNVVATAPIFNNLGLSFTELNINIIEQGVIPAFNILDIVDNTNSSEQISTFIASGTYFQEGLLNQTVTSQGNINFLIPAGEVVLVEFINAEDLALFSEINLGDYLGNLLPGMPRAEIVNGFPIRPQPRPFPIPKKGSLKIYRVSVLEPSSTLSLLALGTLGAASTLKRKLKPSKSTEKETTKVS